MPWRYVWLSKALPPQIISAPPPNLIRGYQALMPTLWSPVSDSLIRNMHTKVDHVCLALGEQILVLLQRCCFSTALSSSPGVTAGVTNVLRLCWETQQPFLPLHAWMCYLGTGHSVQPYWASRIASCYQ